MAVYKEEGYEYNNYFMEAKTQTKIIFFRWTKRRGGITQVLFKQDEGYFGVTSDGIVVVTIKNGKYYEWKDLGDFLEVFYRWDGQGIPVIAGGNL